MINSISDNGYVESYIADKEADMTTIKKIYNLRTCAPGSTCFVIETGNVYMMDSTGEWNLI